MRNDSLFTPGARRHLRLLLRSIRPLADRLDRQFRALLRQRPYDAAQIRALLAITPAAGSRLRTLAQFLEQVEYQGRRLARLNLPLQEVSEILGEFGALLDQFLAGSFAPSREQLQMVTRLALNQAYYQVREAESQAFFGLYNAQAEAVCLEDLLDRLVTVLTRTFHARSGRLQLLAAPPTGKLARPLYIEHDSRDEHLIACPTMRGAHASYWSFPIQQVALLQLGFAVPYPWLPRELAMLHAAGARCFEALERARMQDEMRRLEAQARRAEEDERRRIGRDLHDEAAQSLVLLRLQLEMMEKDAPAALRPRLVQARLITERTVGELRRTIAALSPAVVERLGLQAALRQLAARCRRQQSAGVTLRISPGVAGLSLDVQEVIYRVAKEALQNVSKHSQASSVKLLLGLTDKRVRLSIQDNGDGFIPETARGKPMSFGLAGMQERAALLGGTLALRSAPGKGAAVILELPRASAKGVT
ncbi:MAG: sensor histidine kinase [Candidatus Solibacter sp.]|nr:sensor histidine kinase [Candidatus Solibacter sp.]